MKVAVIGAGAAGLCAVRHLCKKPSIFQPVCFEQGNRIGGTWIYTDKTGVDENGLPIHSSMYKNLRTNLPKEVMAFPEFPFDEQLPSFINHYDVLKYLEDYTAKYSLAPFIKTHVLKVDPVFEKDKENAKWEVSYTSSKCRTTEENKITEIFDAVIVCNGHYFKPIIPPITGLGLFQGEVIHSHNYRDEASMRNKLVVLLGAGASGQDIAVEVSRTAKMVYLSHNHQPLQSVLPENFEQKSGIESVTENSVILKSGENLPVDVILLCTGYHYSFPFLTEQCQLTVDKHERITPLYKHLIHTEYTTLSFIGLCKTICPFPHFNLQIQFVLKALEGSFKLPSKTDMNKDTQKDFDARLSQGLPPRYAHTLGTRQWAYNNELAALANIEPLPKAVEILYNMVHEKRVKNIAGYKKLNYKMISPESFETIEPHTVN